MKKNKILNTLYDYQRECVLETDKNKNGIVVLPTGTGKTFVHRFKVKGELHAGKSKVKTLSKVDDEKINKAREIADKVTPSWRLAQMIEKSCNLANGGELDRAKLGTYLKMVMDDVIKEDLDILVEAGLEPKDISKYISEIARKYFFEQEKL